MQIDNLSFCLSKALLLGKAAFLYPR
jgi:hypothetical protein